MPVFIKYKNDWAIKVMAQRFLKNQRKEAVKKGELAAPSTSERARANASRRGVGGHGNKAKRVLQDYQVARAAHRGPTEGDDEDE